MFCTAKKIIKATTVVGILVLLQSNLFAISEKSLIYSNGVNDTMLVWEKYLENNQANIFEKTSKLLDLKGFAVFSDVSKMSEVNIIRASAIGLKRGYSVKLVDYEKKEYLLFGIENRKADADFIQNTLISYNIQTRVKKINVKTYQKNLISQKIIKIIKENFKEYISSKDNRIKELEEVVRKLPNNKKTNKAKTASSAKKNIYIKISNLQVVNRVVTDTYIKKSKKKLEVLNAYAKKHITKKKLERQKVNVANNIKKDLTKPLPPLKTFSSVYKYLRTHGGITVDGMLVLNGQAYKPKDMIFGRVISKINRKTGLVVLNNSYNVTVKKHLLKEK